MSGDWPGPRQALEECADLAAVCRERALPGIEHFPPNEFYGSDRVLKRYARLPLDRPLKVVVPHGIVLNDSFVWTAEARARLPAVMVYGEHRMRAYRRRTRKMLIRSAVPFAYAARLVGTSPAERRGTVVFPSHSTHRITAQADFERMAESLLALDARFRPVTVCIYWRDYELGRHQPFLERGLRVVSAGHIYDAEFLFRLVHLLGAHRYAASNEAGSSLFYSVIAGCEFFMLPNLPANRTGTDEAMRSDVSTPDAMFAGIAVAFASGEGLAADQRAIVARASGLDDLLEAEQLRECLAAAERLDRIGVVAHPQAGGACFYVPMRPVRALRRAIASMRAKAA
jgi:hypothetical protein